MAIAGQSKMAYGMQRVRADDLTNPVVFGSVKL